MTTAAKPAPATKTIAIFPEHGTGRAAKLTTCLHCGGKPLIIRSGFHHR